MLHAPSPVCLVVNAADMAISCMRGPAPCSAPMGYAWSGPIELCALQEGRRHVCVKAYWDDSSGCWWPTTASARTHGVALAIGTA